MQALLPFGSVQEIRSEVVRIAKIFENRGGYVMSTSHVIMDDVPEDNVVALYDTVRAVNR